jgi:release factor glutamine methyltransferase
MDQSLYNRLLERLECDLVLLPDKPEESAETTLAALWWTAAGSPLSAEKAAQQPIEDLDTRQQERLVSLVDQRLSGTPLAHITGRQQFMGVELLAGPEALIPRKETEILGRTASELLKKINNKDDLIVVDVCTGAGNLAVSLALQSPTCKVFASDLSGDAVSLARKNITFHHLEDRVKVFTGDLLDPFVSENFYGKIDLLICNPPYISSAKVSDMEGEISGHEPALAFDGGSFGIKILHRLIKEAPRYIKKGGWLVFEVGLGQGTMMMKRMKKFSYTRITPIPDANGRVRVIHAVNGGGNV